MTSEQALEKLLPAFERYYNIKKEGAFLPFDAEAEFHSHSEQYLLVRAAKIADIDSNEFVFFSALEQELTAEKFLQLDLSAWNEGLGRVKAVSGHRNSDVTLVILAQSVSSEAVKKIKKANQSKTYKLGIYGWSNHFVAVMDLSSGKIYSNRLGKNTAEVLNRTLAAKA